MRLFVLALVSVVALSLRSNAAELTDSDKQFLAGYEKVRAALAADNLPEAKKAATEMGDEGTALTKADSLIIGRREFEKMSARAIELTKGQSGYYRVNCPMLKKDWVQTSEKISNPYAGREMLTCGVVKK